MYPYSKHLFHFDLKNFRVWNRSKRITLPLPCFLKFALRIRPRSLELNLVQDGGRQRHFCTVLTIYLSNCVRYFAELYTSALLFYGSLEGRWNICRQASSFMLWSFQQVEQEGKTSNRWRVDFVGCYCACSAKRLKHLNLLFLKWNNHLVLNYLPLFNTYVFRISMANEIKGSTRKAWNKSEEFATQIYRIGKC